MQSIEKIIVQAVRINTSINNAVEMLIWVNVPTTPKIKAILITLEPIMLTSAKSFSPLTAAIMLVVSSGKLVPIATMVKPDRKSVV